MRDSEINWKRTKEEQYLGELYSLSPANMYSLTFIEKDEGCNSFCQLQPP